MKIKNSILFLIVINLLWYISFSVIYTLEVVEKNISILFILLHVLMFTLLFVEEKWSSILNVVICFFVLILAVSQIYISVILFGFLLVDMKAMFKKNLIIKIEDDCFD